MSFGFSFFSLFFRLRQHAQQRQADEQRAAAGLLAAHAQRLLGHEEVGVDAGEDGEEVVLECADGAFGGVAAMVLILGAVLFGFQLGIWFSVAMIALAGGSILYQTQNIIRRYPVQAHVAASLTLFTSVMMLFWYVLRLLMQMRR